MPAPNRNLRSSLREILLVPLSFTGMFLLLVLLKAGEAWSSLGLFVAPKTDALSVNVALSLMSSGESSWKTLVLLPCHCLPNNKIAAKQQATL